MNALSTLYGAAANWRRRWHAADPSRTRALARPVISVGNLRAGGSGKTPLVAYLAEWLMARGERPAILSRGYARRIVVEGVTVVSDGERILADLDHAGDEPLMLARAVPGARVLVATDRHLAGTLAERQLGASVHILDDGFQHVRLRRTVDLLLVHPEDLDDRVIPAGHLREPLANASLASAVLVATDNTDVALEIGRGLGAAATFRMARTMGPVRTLDGAAVAAPGRVLAIAAIAKPDQFVAGLAPLGVEVAAAMKLPDHHRFQRAELDRFVARASADGLVAMVTTAKDAVRIEPFLPLPIPVLVVPLSVTVHPAEEFSRWLASRLGLE